MEVKVRREGDEEHDDVGNWVKVVVVVVDVEDTQGDVDEDR